MTNKNDRIIADFLDELIAARTAKNPNFPQLLKTAEKRRLKRLNGERLKQKNVRVFLGCCDHFGCKRKATTRVMVSRSAHESARYASACKKHEAEMREDD